VARVGLATWAMRLPLPDQEDALLAGALRELDVDVRRIIWDRDPLDCDLCVIRTTWDYFERRDEFLDWVARAARRCPLWNPPELVRWNLHKGYLRELEAARVAVPETVFIDDRDIVEVVRERGWDRVIVKPAIGVGAIGSLVASLEEERQLRERVAALRSQGDVLAQEYLPSIHTAGECSLVFFDGRLSHAVRKIPAIGDYRAHPYWGATVDRITPSPAQVALAVAALDAAPAGPLYARVDLLERDDGGPALIELELIEPYLFLDEASASRFARAIADRLG
jgi:glutathione synthase/RimK-type ligase-like ATP-grasp enzyme